MRLKAQPCTSDSHERDIVRKRGTPAAWFFGRYHTVLRTYRSQGDLCPGIVKSQLQQLVRQSRPGTTPLHALSETTANSKSVRVAKLSVQRLLEQ